MIDKELVERARNIDLVDFLGSYKGLTFSNKSSEYRCKEHSSLVIRMDRRSFYWHSKSIGGYGAIDFITKIDNIVFSEAMEIILSTKVIHIAPGRASSNETRKSLALPEKANSYRRLYAYLCKTRGLDNKIIDLLIQEKKLFEDIKGNVVFIGCDENGAPKFACLRGTYTEKQFRMDCKGSDKRYSFNLNFKDNKRLYIFESPIDLISHATLENLINKRDSAYKYDNRLSLGGTSDIALSSYIEYNKNINELVFCLDNDVAGRSVAVELARKYTEKGYITRLEIPQHKDYNLDLLEFKKKQLQKSVGLER